MGGSLHCQFAGHMKEIPLYLKREVVGVLNRERTLISLPSLPYLLFIASLLLKVNKLEHGRTGLYIPAGPIPKPILCTTPRSTYCQATEHTSLGAVTWV